MAKMIDKDEVLELTHEIIIGDYRHRCIDPAAVKELKEFNVDILYADSTPFAVVEHAEIDRGLYLIRIETQTGLFLYIDELSNVYRGDHFTGLNDPTCVPHYFNDFEDAKLCAEMYEGVVVKCFFGMDVLE